LAAGRLTLPEAAARFRAIDEGGPAVNESVWRADVRRRFPDASDDECLYRHVIDWVETVLAEWPEESAAVTRRLGAELEAHFRGG
jgi:hypothetical protein